MKTHIFYSGSKGNCTYISDGETSILVDAGGSFKRIKENIEKLGDSLENVKGIFVTHQHIDHIKALKHIVKKYSIRIFTTVETARAICTPTNTNTIEDCQTLASNVMTVKAGKTYEIGTMTIRTFPTPHDVEASLGFLFNSTKDKKGIGYATDIGQVTDDMRQVLIGVKNIIIESNHDVNMLISGSYPEYLKERILSPRGHLSNFDCAEFIKELYEAGCRSFTLAHLSEENNLPTLALESARGALIGKDDYSLKVASAYSPTEVEIF